MEKFEKKIWLATPTMHGDEMKYVQQAYDTNWMSTVGENINEVERIAAEKAELVFAYGPNADRVAAGALTGGVPQMKIGSYTDQSSMIEELKRLAKPGDVLLFKGSRGMHMEWILEGFLSKNTEDDKS